MVNAGYHSVGTLGDLIAQTDVVLAHNHRQYFVCDSDPHGIALIQGDQMLPVGHFLVLNQGQNGNPSPSRNVLEIWSDANSDHHIEPNEVQRITSIDGKPLPVLAEGPGSMWMARNGDIYLATVKGQARRVGSIGNRLAIHHCESGAKVLGVVTQLHFRQ